LPRARLHLLRASACSADNVAHENLVLFNDALWSGDFNGKGTAGYGQFAHTLFFSWSRDVTCFGYALQLNSALDEGQAVRATVNLYEGKMRVNEREWVFRVDENQWWKTHFRRKRDGTPAADEVVYMYRWLKVRPSHPLAPASLPCPRACAPPMAPRLCSLAAWLRVRARWTRGPARVVGGSETASHSTLRSAPARSKSTASRPRPDSTPLHPADARSCK
jgi:hypothetical protein